MPWTLLSGGSLQCAAVVSAQTPGVCNGSGWCFQPSGYTLSHWAVVSYTQAEQQQAVLQQAVLFGF